MKHNIEEVAELHPDYLGFIFWKPSMRFFDGSIPKLPKTTIKVGVFVDANIDEILNRTNTFDLNAIQLHGNESPEFCAKLKEQFEYQDIKIVRGQINGQLEQKQRLLTHYETLLQRQGKPNSPLELPCVPSVVRCFKWLFLQVVNNFMVTEFWCTDK